MSTPVDAEQAWKDLQRIRVPQERVYDEMERSGSGGPGATYAAAALMWAFLAGVGLDLPLWGVWLAVAVYVALLSALLAIQSRRSRMRLHHSRYNRRTFVTFAGGALVTGGTALLAGLLVEPLEPPLGGLIRATVTTAAFLLFTGPASRWAIGSLRGHAARAAHGGAGHTGRAAHGGAGHTGRTAHEGGDHTDGAPRGGADR
ncbi:hypothetical protein [Streptomyces capillispiralis]|uniref:Uncharacterized protein n=1 Tax=Streptomyces capillispiralis TaxID=68182 RepID=A0A561TCH6_9ACTN|nr:hypothetical protein [Streptomyces capillispiralis]TWF84817.1 hypothetical protein FHX78_111753 [Streptomyces capillispiralis]